MIDDDEILVVGICGSVDISNSFDIAEAVLADGANTTLGVILDLSEAGYLDSAGVHLVIDLRRRLASRRQALRLVVTQSSVVHEVLELTNITALTPVHGIWTKRSRRCSPSRRLLGRKGRVARGFLAAPEDQEQ